MYHPNGEITVCPKCCVVTRLEIGVDDWPEFLELRERIRVLLGKRLDPVWGFVHKKQDVVVSWEGCEIVRKDV